MSAMLSTESPALLLGLAGEQRDALRTVRVLAELGQVEADLHGRVLNSS